MKSCPLCNGIYNKISYGYKDMVIYKCSLCGMLFQDPERLPRENPQLIEQMYTGYFSKIQHQLSLNRNRLERIRRYQGRPFSDLNVLEIGVGSGALGSLIVKAGASYQGLEPSATFYNNLIEKFPELKGRILNKSYEDAYFKDNYFDLLIMTDILEHIQNPVDFLKKIKKCLKDDGILYIEVPNESLLAFKGWLRGKFKLYGGYPTNPEHVNLFTKATLRRTLASAGFNIKSLFQVTVWGDPQRLGIAMDEDNLSWWLKCASLFFRRSKIDIILQQGVLVSVAHKLQ